jgi:Rrf2 family iron-sulfur cluster assembly transcriptional regulator
MHEIITRTVRLTSKGRYGVRALFHLAYHHGQAPAQMRSIAEEAHVPLRFLEQIFHELKRAGLLTAKRGPNGGYQLARPPTQISLGDVVRALEGSAFALTRADERDAGRDPMAAVFVELAHDVERCFDKVTLADLCAKAERFGLARKRRGDEGPEYAI